MSIEITNSVNPSLPQTPPPPAVQHGGRHHLPVSQSWHTPGGASVNLCILTHSSSSKPPLPLLLEKSFRAETIFSMARCIFQVIGMRTEETRSPVCPLCDQPTQHSSCMTCNPLAFSLMLFFGLHCGVVFTFSYTVFNSGPCYSNSELWTVNSWMQKWVNICLSTIQQSDNLAHIAIETSKYLYSASDTYRHFQSSIKEFMNTE